MYSVDWSFAEGTNGSHVEQSLYRVEARCLRRQARDLLRLIGLKGQGRLSQEGRRLLYSLALLLMAQGVWLEPQGLGQAQRLLKSKAA